MIVRDSHSPAGRDLGPARGFGAGGGTAVVGEMVSTHPAQAANYERCGRGGCERRLSGCHIHRPRTYTAPAARGRRGRTDG
jgi:hypothetical protein